MENGAIIYNSLQLGVNLMMILTRCLYYSVPYSMLTSVYTCHPVLQPYIQAYMHCSVGDRQQRIELDLFPVGHGVLTFILDEKHFLYNTELNKSYNVRFNFTGQLDHYLHLNTSSASMIYVLFKPFGAFRILGIPQQQFLNECLSVSDILGDQIHSLCHKMEEQVSNPLQVINILENWLITQLHKNSRLETDRVAHTCQQIIAGNGTLPIKKLYRLCNMSKSSLERHFKEQVGVSPKMFSRIVRFNRVNKFLKDTATSDWQELIYRYGYFDQSHFIHEFKLFFGYTPSQMHLSHQNLSGHVSEHTPRTL